MTRRRRGSWDARRARWPRAAAALALACLTAVPAASATDLTARQELTPRQEATSATDPPLVLQGECNQNAPLFAGVPPQLLGLPLDQIWSHSRGQGVTVAVIDTGVDAGNPQLAPALVPGKDIIGGSASPIGEQDPNGHGSMVAGIIAARPLAGTGVVGLAPAAQILPLRQGGTEQSTAATLATAILTAVQMKARIINISEATAVPSPVLQNAVNTALAAGVIVVAAAGNDALGNMQQGQDQSNIPANAVMYPAAYPGVIAVGAVDQNGLHASFSETGPYLSVAAPGVGLVSTVPGGGHCQDSGTSYSAPFVSGVLALVMAEHPEWSAAQVIDDVEATADGGGSWNDQTGYGVVDPLAALTMIDRPALQPVAPPASPQYVPAESTHGLDQAAAHERSMAAAVFGVSAGVTALVIGGTVALRDLARRNRPRSATTLPSGDVLAGALTDSQEEPGGPQTAGKLTQRQ